MANEGYTKETGEFYVSRAVYNGVMTPGRYKPAEERCFVTMDGKEYALADNFEVLTNPNKCFVDFIKARDGTLPKGAIEAGDDPKGGKAYSARYRGGNSYMVGKFYKSTNLMYYGWGGGETTEKQYEILVISDKAPDHTLHPTCANNKPGFDSFVCVCTEGQPCQKLEGPTKTAPGVLTKWESTAQGNRFTKTVYKLEDKGKHVDIDKVGSQLYVKLNRDVKHQEVVGFGGAFTDATGINIKKMGDKLGDQLIADCYGKEGLEYNMGRIPIGGSDFSTRTYSLDDEQGTEEDKTLAKFNLTSEDLEYKIPIIQKAAKMAGHDLLLFGSPWSAPAWMKDNNKLIYCGAIKGKPGTEYWQIYAKYLVKYLDAYKSHGLGHWGLTVQNEPYACDTGWNSMWYSPETMRAFVGQTLGPELEKSGYPHDKFKIMTMDHNVGMAKDWVNLYYQDPDATKYTWGTAIHWYGHDPKEQLDGPHQQHPDKPFLATEACVEGSVKMGDWNTADLYAFDILSDLLHHVVGWVDWNMVLDTQGGPNWKNNFVDAPLLVDPVKKEYYRQPSYYAMAHFSKFLPPGSYRVDTPLVNSNNNHGVVGGFRTPNGSTVVIAINTEGIEIDLIVEDDKEGKLIEKIAPRSVQTYVYYD